MSAGATFERVYQALREEIGDGVFRPGEPLEPSTLASRLNSSITPVRDALHRLVGERLVEAPRGDGFRAPLLTEMALRNLYRWREWLLVGAVRAPVQSSASPPLGGPGQRAGSAEMLFRQIGAQSGNPEHQAAIEHASARLRPVRAAEDEVLAGTDAETGAMEEALALRSPDLRRHLSAYHRRRIRAAPELVGLLHER